MKKVNYNTRKIIGSILKLDNFEMELADDIKERIKNKDDTDSEYRKRINKLCGWSLAWFGIGGAVIGIASLIGIEDINVTVSVGSFFATVIGSSCSFGTAVTISGERQSVLSDNERLIRKEEALLKQVKETSLKLSSKLLQECDNEKIINKFYSKLIKKRKENNYDSDELALLNSVISEYEERRSQFESETEVQTNNENCVVPSFNLMNYFDEIVEDDKDYVVGFSDDLTQENVMVRKRTL